MERLYNGSTLNCARPLDHNLVIRAIIRNTGYSENLKGGAVFISFPSAKTMYDLVWGMVPDFLKDKIKSWAKGGNEQAIAREITSYVKSALRMPPIPVPSILVNAVVNLVIPPLVRYIVNMVMK